MRGFHARIYEEEEEAGGPHEVSGGALLEVMAAVVKVAVRQLLLDLDSGHEPLASCALTAFAVLAQSFLRGNTIGDTMERIYPEFVPPVAEDGEDEAQEQQMPGVDMSGEQQQQYRNVAEEEEEEPEQEEEEAEEELEEDPSDPAAIEAHWEREGDDGGYGEEEEEERGRGGREGFASGAVPPPVMPDPASSATFPVRVGRVPGEASVRQRRFYPDFSREDDENEDDAWRL